MFFAVFFFKYFQSLVFFIKSDDCIGKTSFSSKKDLKSIRRFFIQAAVLVYETKCRMLLHDFAYCKNTWKYVLYYVSVHKREIIPKWYPTMHSTIQTKYHITNAAPDAFTSAYLLVAKVAEKYMKICFYEWAKQTKFLLAVIYGSPRRHSNSSKIFKKIWKNWNKIL